MQKKVLSSILVLSVFILSACQSPLTPMEEKCERLVGNLEACFNSIAGKKTLTTEEGLVYQNCVDTAYKSIGFNAFSEDEQAEFIEVCDKKLKAAVAGPMVQTLQDFYARQ